MNGHPGFSRRVAGLAVLAGLAMCSLGAHEQDRRPSDPNLAADLDAIVSAVYGPGGPGVAVIVVKDDRVVLRKGYGLASVELQVPMRPEMVFPLASLTKQFTAAAVLSLAEEGKLSVDDDLTRFLPAFPSHGVRITLEHLLTHTSGISALTDLSDLRAVSNQEARVVDVMGAWYKDQPPDFPPGERWAYLGWGYNLLGAVIEQVSGQSYAEFLDRRFFQPLGMTATAYGDMRQLIPLRAPGYDLQEGRVFNVLQGRSRNVHPSGAGGLVSTVDDLARWDRALGAGRVLGQPSLVRMFTAARLASGASTGYGYGWNIGQYDGHLVHEHAGGISGYLTYALRLPDDHVYVAILSNVFSFVVPPQTTAHRLAARAIGHPIDDIKPVPLDAEALPGFVGSFRSQTQTTYQVTLDGAQLLLQLPGLEKMRMVPVGPQEFRSPSVTWRLSFERDSAGQVSRLLVRDWTLNETADRVAATRIEPRAAVAVSPQLLVDYVGEYELLTGIIQKVVLEGDHLVIQPTGQRGTALLAASPAEFFASDSALAVTFVRDGQGLVTGLIRSSGGLRLPARRLR
jgi:D-alanyl-D-alanine carboxypeptidase